MKKQKMQYKKMPGTARQRNRARHILKCDKAGEKWLVYGGDASHYVSQTEEGFSCECNVFQKEKKLCSHIIKVRMILGLFPTEPILVPMVKK